MTGRPPLPPLARPRPDLPVVQAAWLALWRAFWADLPLTWVGGDRPLSVPMGAAGLRSSDRGPTRRARLIWYTLSEKGAAQAGQAGAEVEDHPGLRG